MKYATTTWLRGDRVVCSGCGSDSEVPEFVGPDRPLCRACRRTEEVEHAA